MNKIIYYYQTFIGLRKILEQKPICVTHIIVSSIHFGYTNNIPYIHLNNNNPNEKIYNKLWSDLKIAHNLGIKILLMVGGAGLAYQKLFSNFNTFYLMLKKEILKRPYIEGIDLDIEENTNLNYVQLLINQINKDFGNNFIITMAPIANSLQYNCSGMGGFSYKKLFNSIEGRRINWFNGQFYGCFNYKTYKNIINNGYPVEKVVIGMISSDFNKKTFDNALKEIKKIKVEYNNFSGVFNWEYFDAPPNNKDPSEWAYQLKKLVG